MPELQPVRGWSRDIQQAVDQKIADDPLNAARIQQAGGQMRRSPLTRIRPGKYPILIVLIVLWSLASFGLVPLAGFIFDFGAGSFIAFCLSGVLWVVGAAAILIGGSLIMDRLISSRLGDPMVNASTDRLRRGDTLDIDFIQEIRKNMAIGEVRIKFYKKESATYTRGTDRVTVTHSEIFGEHVAPPRQAMRGTMINERASFQLPTNAMHTFKADDNKIEYFLDVKVDIPNWPDFNETYELPVLPEAVSDTGWR